MKTIENELIPVYENEKGNRLVNGRELHGFLKVQKDFSDWIKNQLEMIEAYENKDFNRFPFKREGNNATLIEYALTIDTAKEICMIAGIAPRANEETKKLSKQARRYFIKVEEKYKGLDSSTFEGPKQLTVLDTLNAVKFIADDLRVNEASRTNMYSKACENAGINSNFLPQYTDGKVVKSLKNLLEEFNIGMSSIAFNKLLLEKGYIEELERPSSTKGTKKYKSITEKASKYGENHKSPKNILETQPLWYENTFQELVNTVMNAGEKL